jgi:predicted Zn-dependent peptidase
MSAVHVETVEYRNGFKLYVAELPGAGGATFHVITKCGQRFLGGSEEQGLSHVAEHMAFQRGSADQHHAFHKERLSMFQKVPSGVINAKTSADFLSFEFSGKASDLHVATEEFGTMVRGEHLRGISDECMKGEIQAILSEQRISASRPSHAAEQAVSIALWRLGSGPSMSGYTIGGSSAAENDTVKNASVAQLSKIMKKHLTSQTTVGLLAFHNCAGSDLTMDSVKGMATEAFGSWERGAESVASDVHSLPDKLNTTLTLTGQPGTGFTVLRDITVLGEKKGSVTAIPTHQLPVMYTYMAILADSGNHNRDTLLETVEGHKLLYRFDVSQADKTTMIMSAVIPASAGPDELPKLQSGLQMHAEVMRKVQHMKCTSPSVQRMTVAALQRVRKSARELVLANDSARIVAALELGAASGDPKLLWTLSELEVPDLRTVQGREAASLAASSISTFARNFDGRSGQRTVISLQSEQAGADTPPEIVHPLANVPASPAAIAAHPSGLRRAEAPISDDSFHLLHGGSQHCGVLVGRGAPSATLLYPAAAETSSTAGPGAVMTGAINSGLLLDTNKYEGGALTAELTRRGLVVSCTAADETQLRLMIMELNRGMQGLPKHKELAHMYMISLARAATAARQAKSHSQLTAVARASPKLQLAESAAPGPGPVLGVPVTCGVLGIAACRNQPNMLKLYAKSTAWALCGSQNVSLEFAESALARVTPSHQALACGARDQLQMLPECKELAKFGAPLMIDRAAAEASAAAGGDVVFSLNFSEKGAQGASQSQVGIQTLRCYTFPKHPEAILTHTVMLKNHELARMPQETHLATLLLTQQMIGNGFCGTAMDRLRQTAHLCYSAGCTVDTVALDTPRLTTIVQTNADDPNKLAATIELLNTEVLGHVVHGHSSQAEFERAKESLLGRHDMSSTQLSAVQSSMVERMHAAHRSTMPVTLSNARMLDAIGNMSLAQYNDGVARVLTAQTGSSIMGKIAQSLVDSAKSQNAAPARS